MKYQAPAINYSKIKTGDIIFTGGRGIFSRLIRRITARGKSQSEAVTHVAIAFDVHGQILIAEMLGSGLSISSLEEYRKGPRRFIIGIGTIKTMTDYKREELAKVIALHRRKTIEYDYPGIFEFLTIGHEDPNRFYCSEYAAKLLFDFAGIRIVRGDTGGISPEDLFEFFTIDSRAEMIDYKA